MKMRMAMQSAFVLFTLLVSAGVAKGDAPIQVVSSDLASLSLEELGSIEVTSVSKTPERFIKAPAAIFVITQDDIRRSGVTTIAEALRLAPGVDVARVNSNEWSVGVRGFGDRLARSVLVLMDGRAIYSPLFGGVYWEVQDYLLEDIDRIEVIRGPGGALWGANAVNGVINIITKSAAETQGGLAQAGGGSEERGFGSLRYGGKVNENLHYRVYGKYFNRDSAFHSNGDNYDDWWMGRGGFRSDWEVNNQDSLTVQGDLYRGDTGESVTLGSYVPPYSETHRGEGELSGANVLGRWKRLIDETSDLSLQWYYDRTNRLDQAFREFRNTFDVEFQHHFGWWMDQEFTWGSNYRLTSDLIDSIPAIVFDPGNRTNHLFSAFIQNQIPLIENRLRLTIGTKVEHNDFSGWEVEPSGRLAWTPTENQTLWTAVSRAVRTPTRGDQDLDITLPGVPLPPTFTPAFLRLVGSEDFQSENLMAYEAGYRVHPVQPLFVDIAFFYNRYDDLRTGEFATPFVEVNPLPVHFVFPVIEGNKMEGETHGVEWSSTWNAFEWWRWRATYSFLLINLRLQSDSLDPSPRPEATKNSSPRHQALLQWSIDLPGNFEWDPMVRYTDVVSALDVPPYWNLDMRLAWQATPRLELALVGQNLCQDHHPEADASQEIQRAVYGKATWKW